MGLLLMMGIAVAVRSAIKLVVKTNQVALKVEEMQLAPTTAERRSLAYARYMGQLDDDESPTSTEAGIEAAHTELSKKTRMEVLKELYELVGIPQ